MKTVLLTCLSSILTTLSIASSQEYWPYKNFTEGLAFSVQAEKWNEFKDANWEFFVDNTMLMNLTEVDLGDNVGFMKDNTYSVTSRADQAKFILSPDDNSVIVNADGFESVFFSEYTRIRKGLITLSGHTEAVEHNMGCSASFVWTSLPANDTNTTGRRLMGVKVGYALVRVDSDQLDFKIEGNLFADFLGKFSSMYLPVAVAQIEEALALLLQKELPPIVNALFTGVDGYGVLFPDNMPNYQDMLLDFAVNSNPKVTNEYIGFKMKAMWFNKLHGYREVVSRAEPVPYRRPENKEPLQIYANKLFWDSYTQTYIESNPGWGFNLTQAQLGPRSPIHMNTFQLNLYFPGLRHHYAAYNDPVARMGLPMRALFEFQNLTEWDSWEEAQQMGIVLDMVMHLNVTMPDGTEEIALQWMFERYHWNVTLDVKGLVIYVHLQKGWVENIRLIQCVFCDPEYPLDLELYKHVFNTVLAPESLILDTIFNPTLKTLPIVWPTELLGLVAMTNLKFKYYDGYMYMGSDMSWIPFPIPHKRIANLPWPDVNHETESVHM